MVGWRGGGVGGGEEDAGLNWPELKLWRQMGKDGNDAGCDGVDLSLSLAASSRSQHMRVLATLLYAGPALSVERFILSIHPLQLSHQSPINLPSNSPSSQPLIPSVSPSSQPSLKSINPSINQSIDQPRQSIRQSVHQSNSIISRSID